MNDDRARDALLSAFWPRLTVMHEKQVAYSDDLYFREGWADVVDVLGPSPLELLRCVAMMNVKPDAVVGRRLSAILDYAVARGFRPIASSTLALNRHSIRALWRHDWHVYPTDRLAFSSVWYTSADIIAFFFEDATPHERWPATLRLAQMKGNWLPERRKPDDLRSVLAPPNRILNFVHVADEPADIVREMGVLFDRRERRSLLASLAASVGRDRSGEVRAEIAALEARHPFHDLDFGASVARLERAGAVTAEGAGRLRGLAAGGGSLDWDALCEIVDPEAPSVPRWDFISVAAVLIVPEREVAGLLPAVATDRW